MTDIQTFCPKHFTLDGEDCFDGLVDCPPRVEVDPTKHLIIRCGPCDRTRVIPVDRVMKGKTPKLGSCSLDVCAAQLVLPEVEAPAVVVPEALGTGHDPDTATNSAEVKTPEPDLEDALQEELEEKAKEEPTPPSINQAAKPRSPKKATSGKASQ